MSRLQNGEKGFSVIEALLILLVVVLIGFIGSLIYKNSHKTTTTALNKNSSTARAKGTPTLTYAQCMQSASHTTDQISYTAGTTHNSQGSILNVCNTITGISVADTTNSQLTPIKQSTVTKFSDITDANLKSAVLSSDLLKSSGCESNGGISDSNVSILGYIPGAVASVSANNCVGTNPIGSVLLTDVNGSWKILNTNASGVIGCSLITQYKIPLLFLVLVGPGTCYNSNGTYRDLVSGVTS